MTVTIPIVGDVSQLRAQLSRWRANNLLTAIVPTMGALHDGHLALVSEAIRRADRVIVSIFVNPKQFAEGEDLDTYPRDLSNDVQKLGDVGAHIVYAPSLPEMYPENFSTVVAMTGPATVGLEDKYRPHFFDGVATVVAKLFMQGSYDYAVFGEKDYQQLKVVTRMAADLDIPTTVIGMPTIRHDDGLAMSSRNAYLSKKQRSVAPRLYCELQRCAQDIRQGVETAKATEFSRQRLGRAGFTMDYFTARNTNTLALPRLSSEPLRLLAAGSLGKTRLIDNVAV